MVDYKDKNIFVGIDVHKKTYSVTAVMDQEVIKKDRIEAKPEKLLAYLHKYYPQAKLHTAYEAGFFGFALHRFLMNNKINSIVVHAASIEIAARERVKSDKRDSHKIAVQLSSGRLRCVYIPELDQENRRLVSRYRDVLSREKVKKGNQIKSFLYQVGKIPFDNESRITNKWLSSILNQDYSIDQFYCLTSLISQWTDLNERIKCVEKEFIEQAKRDSTLEHLYRSVPGIGAVSARVLANELGNMKQFKNERRLFSYTGLTPREYSSGEHRRLGHISRQGKPILRKILVQAAWTAIKMDRGLFEIFHRLQQRSGSKRAIVAVARRMIGRMRSCINKNESYKIQLKEVQTTA